jgi:hypothetical protein
MPEKRSHGLCKNFAAEKILSRLEHFVDIAENEEVT